MKYLNQKIFFFIAVILAFSFCTVKATERNKKTNILVFIADDLARNDLPVYGGENVNTPNINRLAENGIIFDQMYSSTSMCCPTRASIYTGLYPMHHGVIKNHQSAKPEIKSVAHYLSEMGYRVGLTGKTHISPAEVYPFQFINGFEPNCVSETADYNLDEIQEFMEQDNDQPFCLYVCSTNPHVPWTAGDPKQFNPDSLQLPPVLLDNKETRLAYSKYLAEIAELDKQLGDIISTLKETDNYDNTLIIFCGEQGPQFPGGKWTCWDYGQSSAFMVKLPGKNESFRTNALAQYEDLLPTMIDYINETVPENLDGKSFLPVLKKETDSHRNWVYGIHNNIPEGFAYPIRCIRNEEYKLILNLSPELVYYEKHLMGLDKQKYWNSWVRDAKQNTNASSLVLRYLIRPEIEFYNLKEDPWELENLAENNNSNISLIESMKTELLNWLKEQGDPGKDADVK